MGNPLVYMVIQDSNDYILDSEASFKIHSIKDHLFQLK